VVINTQKAAAEILDRRGAKYQDRPKFVLFEELGWGLTLTFLPFGNSFKLHRSALQTNFTKSHVVNYQPVQEEEVRLAVRSMLDRPQDWNSILRRFAAAVVLRIGFGVNVNSDNDPYVQISADAGAATAQGGDPGASLVDHIPLLRHVPNILNFSAPLRHARSMRWAIKRLHDVPFAAITKDFHAGKANPSFATTLLTKYYDNQEKGVQNKLEIRDIQGMSAAVFIAGSNTTLATTRVGLFNLINNPHVLAKAREELDRVVGTDRLPRLSDRPKLRYIEYIVEETTRWRPLSPVGIPHKSNEDDIYEGLYIPKGTLVYYNTYALSKDTSVYLDPDKFNPDRFTPVEEGGRGEPFLAGPFGFGRRICVGRHLAQASVFSMLATMISTMDISAPVGLDGKPVMQVLKFSTGLSSHPGEFDMVLRPRSERAAALLRDG
jgi:cytochrome P450